MKISIIIPFRGRGKQLDLCLFSIFHSGEVCKPSGLEVIAVEPGRIHRYEMQCGKWDVVHFWEPNSARDMEMFNKPRLQNIGIEEAKGDIIAFLDADAIVGPRWFDSFAQLEADPSLTRLCWRVRYLSEDHVDQLFPLSPDEREAALSPWFATYDSFPGSFEAYGVPHYNGFQRGSVFGNSQFAMRREVLGDMRYDEKYVGRGYEDLSFIRQVWYRYGEQYKGEIVTDGEHAMFHLANQPGDWFSRNLNDLNRNRYQETAIPELDKRLFKYAAMQ